MYRQGRALASEPSEGVQSAPLYAVDATASMDITAPAQVLTLADWAATVDFPVGDPSKRVFDLVAAVLGIILLAPVLLMVALAVRFTSAGPIIHWSTREGFLGETFRMPKFRTMNVEAPVEPRELMADADAHLTSIGAFLRWTGLDELPQLFTILAGKMSLIGPRPLLADDPAMAVRRSMRIGLHARPGVTGLAQVNGRNAVSPRCKARYDTFYVSKWNWAMDVAILAKTVKIVFLRRGFL